jgi:hypothetical protein
MLANEVLMANQHTHVRFGKRQVSVTMLGEQWFALLAHLAKRPLSDDGIKKLSEATGILRDSLSKECD